MKIFNRYYSPFDLLLLFGDITVILLATWPGIVPQYVVTVHGDAGWLVGLMRGSVMAVLIVLSFYYSDLYAIDQTLSTREMLLRLMSGFGLFCLIVGGTTALIPELGSRKVYLGEAILIGMGLSVWRIGFMHRLKRAKIHAKVLIIGTQTIGKLVAEQLCRQKSLGMKVVGFIGPRAGQVTLSYGNPVRVTLPVSPRHHTLGVVEREGITRILIGSMESCSDFPAQELVTLRLRGIKIEDCHSFYERLMSKIAVADLQPGWIVLSQGFRRTRWILFTKRGIDMLAAGLGLIISAPIVLLTALAIRLESPGAVLYRQERVGQSERTFTLYKFRSMQDNAEEGVGPVWAARNDPRVTRVGKIIRKLRIDEIPQMFNVLRGDMSFVGPRPERPIFVSALKEKIPYYHLRHLAKPGITGWAQVSYSYGNSETDAIEKLQYDLYYIKNISPLFDLQIIFETAKIVLLGRGAQ
jgi:sugar transferase (PEP-CTERM system associated)